MSNVHGKLTIRKLTVKADTLVFHPAADIKSWMDELRGEEGRGWTTWTPGKEAGQQEAGGWEEQRDAAAPGLSPDLPWPLCPSEVAPLSWLSELPSSSQPTAASSPFHYHRLPERLRIQCNLLTPALGCIVSPKDVEALTPSTCGCALIWRQGLGR